MINILRRITIPFSRLSLFVVYFWFGILKVVAESPANPLVSALLKKTLPFITFDQFILILGIFEMVIGLAFLFPGKEKLAFGLMIIHMVTTFMPLFLLPAVTWTSQFVPTLEGQYIIKNLLIISLGLVLLTRRD